MNTSRTLTASTLALALAAVSGAVAYAVMMAASWFMITSA